MAPFNRYLPTEDENYLGYSKGVEAPKPNLALGKLFEGIGSTLDAGLKGGVELLDQKIEKDTRANLNTAGVGSDIGITPEQGRDIGRLKNKMEAGGELLPTGSSGPALPKMAEQELSNLDKMYQQYQNGDLNPTYYLMKQQQVAQQLKQRFPGSEDQIDARIHKETASANAIRSQLYSDFQTVATHANAANKQWDAWVDKNSAILGAEGVVESRNPSVYANRALQTDIMASVARQERIAYDRKTSQDIVAAKRANNALTSEDSEHAFLKEGQGALASMFLGAFSPLGGLQKKIDDVIATGKVDTDFLVQSKSTLNQLRQAAEAEVTKLQTQYGVDIRDPGKVAAIRKQLFEPLDNVEKSLGMGDLTAANWHADVLKRQTEMDTHTLTQLSPVARFIAANKPIGDSTFVTEMIRNQKLPGGQSVLGRYWQDSMSVFMGNALGGTNLGSNMGEMSRPKPEAPGTNKDVPTPVIKYNLDLLEQALTRPDASNDMKNKALDYITRDANGSFFKPLDKTSQLQAYNKLTATSLSKAVSNMGPEQFNKYTNWAQTVANANIMARAKDIRTMVENDQLKYNPETNRLEYNQPPNVSGQAYPEKTSVDQINTGLLNLKSMYDLNKTDPAEKLGPLFKNLGVPIKMPEGEGGKKLNYAPEKQTPEALKAINDALGSALEKGKSESHIKNMSPELKTGLAAMLKDAPQGVEIFSGHRSEERQQELFTAAVKKYGSVAEARRWVAPPGYSMHNTGKAADLRFASPEVRDWVHRNAPKYGLHFPLSNEPWHIEPVGARS